MEPEKRTNTSMKMQDTYTVYLVETRLPVYLHFVPSGNHFTSLSMYIVYVAKKLLVYHACLV